MGGVMLNSNNGYSTDYIFYLNQRLYNEVTTYFIKWENMKIVLKINVILLIEKCKLI